MSFVPKFKLDPTDNPKDYVTAMMDYMIRRFMITSTRNKRFSNIKNAFNGIIDPTRMLYLNNTYGKANLAKYKAYRWSRPKIERLEGEFYDTPLSATVEAVNKDAINKKARRYEAILGAAEMKDSIDGLRSIGVDPFPGYQPAENLEEAKKIALNLKERNEVIIQKLINKHLKVKKIKIKFARDFFNTAMYAECHGVVEMLPNGEVNYRVIDPQDALFEEIEGDAYVEKSPYKGERRRMFPQNIISEFGAYMEVEDRKLVDEMAKNPQQFVSNNYNNNYTYYVYQDQQLIVDVFTLNWKILVSDIIKIEIDPLLGKEITSQLTYEEYRKNQVQIKRDLDEGKYRLEETYRWEIWEATRIGHQIVCKWGPKTYQNRNVDEPGETEYDYFSFLYKTVGGIRVSIMEMLADFDYLLDVIQLQKTKELIKAKGKVLVIDEANLPKGKKIDDISFDIANHGVTVINSRQEGMRQQEHSSIKDLIQEADISMSNTIVQLINLEENVKNAANEVTGLNEPRQGKVKASMTNDNVDQSVVASRNVTDPMFIGHAYFIEKVLLGIAGKEKIANAFLKKDQDLYLSDDDIRFLRVTADLADMDYNVTLTDGLREKRIAKIMENLAGVSLNAKEISPAGVLDMYLQDTVIEMKQVLEKNWNEVKLIQQKSQQAQIEQQAQQAEMQQQQILEDREDRQQHESDMIILKAKLEQGQTIENNQQEVLKESMLSQIENK